MPKSIHDDVLDAALNYIKTNGNELTVCSTEPTTYTQAHTTYKLADVALDSADYTVSDGDTSGRKVRIAQQTDIPIDTTGTANWVCINDTNNSKLLLKTSCTAQSLTSGNTVTTPAYDDEIADPS